MHILAKIAQIIGKIVFWIILLAPAFIFQFAGQTPEVQAFMKVIQNYLVFYLLALLSAKAFSIIYPPLPGAAFTLAAVPFVGWQLAYVIDIVGSALGASLAFYLGKKYGSAILYRVIGHTLTNKIISTKLKPHNQVEAAIFLRLAVGGMLSDGLAWGASLIGFRYLPFIVGYLVSHIITTLPVFYFIASAVSVNSWVILTAVMGIAWLIIYKFKGRYFE